MTTTAVTTAVGNYVDSVYYGARDSSGYLIGSTATAPTAGDQDGSPMAQLVGVQNFPFQPQAAERPSQPGDGGVLARFINKPTELPEGDLAFGASDYDFDALALSVNVVTVGGGRVINRMPYSPTYQDLVMLIVSPAKSQETATLDASMWEARLIYNVNAEPRGRDGFNTSSLPTYNYSIIANYSSAYPWGVSFVAGTDGDVKFVYGDFTWPYRPILARYTGDGTEVTFNLSKNIAEDSSDNIVAYVDGTAQTWVTGVPGAGEFGVTESTTDTIVFGTAPGSDTKVVVLYGWS